MHSLPMHRALRCHAKSKRSGSPCQAPAMRGHNVCRMHGAGGGAPKGNRNALKHGGFTAEGLALKRRSAPSLEWLARRLGRSSSRCEAAYPARCVIAVQTKAMRGPREGVMGLVRRGYLSISEAYEKIVATLEPHARPSDDYLLSLDEDERAAA